MGHIRLGNLPKSKRWREVVAALAEGEDVANIAARAALASENALNQVGADPLVLHIVSLLTELPLAARGPAFVADLQELGLEVSGAPSLLEITSAFSDAVDEWAFEYGDRSDLGEIAHMAAVESLTRVAGANLPSLFEPTPDEVRHGLGRLASGQGFAALAQYFFAQLTERTLNYYLSRELPNHVGPSARFPTDRERQRFNDDLSRHCWEAARIVNAFAGGWYGKTVYQEGGLTPDKVRGFTSFALKKMRLELRKRRDAGE